MTRTAKNSPKHRDTWLEWNDIYIDIWSLQRRWLSHVYIMYTRFPPKTVKGGAETIGEKKKKKRTTMEMIR